MEKNPVAALCLLCNISADIKRILRNDTDKFIDISLPSSFFKIFDDENRSNLEDFWTFLLNYTSIFDWTIVLKVNGLSETYNFSGFKAEEDVYIFAFKIDSQLSKMQTEIDNEDNPGRINYKNEWTKMQLHTDEFQGIDSLNELSRLNNEMVNNQRILIKKNAEITKLNDQLKKANQELEQFTYFVSHDLKEPLRMVTSFMGLLKKNYYHLLDEKAHTYINFAMDGGARMQIMVSDLLDLSRTARQGEEKKSIDLNGIVNEVLENLHNLVQENEAEIVFENTLPEIKAYKYDFIRLFQNLISNAIKFKKPEIKPIITINSNQNSEEWLIGVRDNGIGISPNDFEKVFKIFTRINPTDSLDGSGIGLAICKKVIENCGGKIWIESEKNEGSVFYFTIPKHGSFLKVIES